MSERVLVEGGAFWIRRSDIPAFLAFAALHPGWRTKLRETAYEARRYYETGEGIIALYLDEPECSCSVPRWYLDVETPLEPDVFRQRYSCFVREWLLGRLNVDVADEIVVHHQFV